MASDSGDDVVGALNTVDEQLEFDAPDRHIVMSIASSTDVDHSGLQAWPCCQLVCDWFLRTDTQPRLGQSTILEVGCGPGLVAVVLGPSAKAFVASDHDDDVLSLCKSNLQRNGLADRVQTRRIDVVELAAGDTPFDAVPIENVDYLIACDLVFEDVLTSSLVNLSSRYLAKGARVLIAVESRVNFIVATMAIADVALDHFRRCVDDAGLGLVLVDMGDIASATSLERSPTSLLFEIVTGGPR
ncbi:Methyltransferase small domain-containing protein [Plasmodiophora brassicae]|uniref:Methyltransferase small domain-containing protein n=1 Tax=Plasmodiophora brassicae TaxID=37360 RepID=A0A0G4IN74_PLABS|nr:hypothetical protein PBRA_005231 [Plasmodiophora brassicae]SPQ94680.1 unnamed protein product [Plasmodiophora brassicae]